VLRLRVQQDWIMKTRLSEYVKVAEAAEILGVSQGTIRAWAEAGKIPMHKNPANGYRLFRREELEQFLANIAKPIIPIHPR
jgi:excisionase family DNA binding protein